MLKYLSDIYKNIENTKALIRTPSDVVLMRFLSIINNIGELLLVLGIFMVVIPLVDLVCNEPISMWFLLFSLVYISIGFISFALTYRAQSFEMGIIDALLVYSSAWLILPLISAIPLSMELGIPFIDALFESISGFTGTGLTVIPDLDNLKKSILFWRALMQWTGELGFAVFAMVFVPFFWRYGLIVYSLERPSRIHASLRRTARQLLNIYLILTVAGVLACYYTGMNILDAVVHTMTAIATGGMSTYNMNYQKVFEYAPMSIYPISALMFLGGTSFIVLNLLLNGELRKIWSNEEFKLYIVMSMALPIASTVLILPHVKWSLRDALIYGFFNTLSGLTTTGFNIGSISTLPPSIKLMIIAGMFIGGMSFATTGGIKLARFLILLKKARSYVVHFATAGKASLPVRFNGVILDDDEIANNVFFIVLHSLAILIGAGVIKSVLPDTDFIDAFFEATSAASAVGLSTGITSQTTPFFVKIALISLMYLGRLEYLPLIALLGVTVFRKYSTIFR
ncbi:MAG: TrkH family potassium uptake protein [Desulfurococcaceae archaeon]